MKTLVIHPKDKTTDMLENVYKDHPEYTVCRDNNISKNDLKQLIDKHDRIIMLGHGTPYGLINSKRNGFLIDSTFAPLLKEKETYSVWCYSDQYFRHFQMEGFHTGMIVSEVDEEMFVFGKEILKEKEMLDNITAFCKYLGECIEMSPLEMKNYMLEHYNFTDEVSKFNRENITVL